MNRCVPKKVNARMAGCEVSGRIGGSAWCRPDVTIFVGWPAEVRLTVT